MTVGVRPHSVTIPTWQAAPRAGTGVQVIVMSHPQIVTTPPTVACAVSRIVSNPTGEPTETASVFPPLQLPKLPPVVVPLIVLHALVPAMRPVTDYRVPLRINADDLAHGFIAMFDLRTGDAAYGGLVERMTHPGKRVTVVDRLDGGRYLWDGDRLYLTTGERLQDGDLL